MIRTIMLTAALIVFLMFGAAFAQDSTFTDPRDGQKYRTVTIGDLVWMAENMKFRPKTDNTWCYGNNNSNCEKYGRLYTWNAAMSACPAPWRLPTDEDWDDLVGEIDDEDNTGVTLRSKAGWSKNGNGTDKIGFSALPGGYRSANNGRFYDAGSRGSWWSATERGSDIAGVSDMDSSDSGELSANELNKNYGLSVRCTRDGAVQSPAAGAPAAKTAPVTPPPAQHVTAPATSFTDPRDGQTYRVVKIGKLTWMAENLKFRPKTDNTWCSGHDNSNCDKYGRLYTWDAAMSACPAGWRLPANGDWDDLVLAAGGKNNAGGTLKSKAGWSKNGNGTDKIGFSALPGGYHHGASGVLNRSHDLGSRGYWWSATGNNAIHKFFKWYREISSDGSEVSKNEYESGRGFSVRCVFDGVFQIPATPPPAKSATVPAASPQPSTFTDPRDGQTYRAVTIGDLEWMAQNLNFRPQNEDELDEYDVETWCLNNDKSNCDKYGRLYTWHAAMTACPAEWRLPTKEDWEKLVWEADGKDAAGSSLRAKSGWDNKTNGTDRFGFSALPGSWRSGLDGSFGVAGGGGHWWTSTELKPREAYSRNIGGNWAEVEEQSSIKYYGMSVRCARDAAAQSPATSASAPQPAANTAPVTPPTAKRAKAPTTYSNTFTDPRDSQMYRTVTIGEQTWMAQNLNYKTNNSWCYDNDKSNCDKYGRLYTRAGAMVACPAPWRLPVREEWDDLVGKVDDEEFAGTALKSKTGWSDNGNGTDKFGFSALPGGIRSDESNYGRFVDIGTRGHWWSATGRWGRYMRSGYSSVHESYGYANKSGDDQNGLSVRCIRDGAVQSPAAGAPTPQPAAKTKPTKPAKSAKPTKSAKSAKPTKSAKSAKSVTPPPPAESVTAPAASPSGTFIDPRDGQTYRTVKIGKLTWMAQNLNYIKPQTEDNWCYDNDNSNCGKYGRLYTWNAAMSACPAGWRLPTKDEWGDLIWETRERYYNADIVLKSKTGWHRNGTDRFGFSALPGGRRLDDGRFYRVGSHGVWWSATVGRHSNLARYVEIESNDSINSIANYYTRDISEGSSVRCIRDVTAQRSATGASASKPAAQTAPVTPPPAASSPSRPFTDSRDGQTYRTVRIGDKTWMAQNINYKTKDSWCYGNDNSNCDKYGKLYTWDAAMKACPAPWRLPSDKEWDDLVLAADGKDNAGSTLKSKAGWSNDRNGTDKFSFSALPGGYRHSGKSLNDSTRYRDLGSDGYWWSATVGSKDALASHKSMSSRSSGVGGTNFYKGFGRSVRCIRD